MRILVHGPFYPSIGGIETVVSLLVHEWARVGAEPVIVSNLGSAPNRPSAFPFRVVYQPSALEWFRLVRWSEVVLQMNVSLKALWPHLALNQPLVISHQTFYRTYRSHRSYNHRAWSDHLKLRMLPCAAANIAASAAIGNSLPVPHKVIPNTYDSTLFTQPKSIPRDRDLVFVGRLVSEKGADLLLNVMAILKCASPGIRLTIIGDGPERGALENQAANLKLLNRVRFAGPLDQDQVAKELQRHKVLVVPSVYTEPFGVVALEGAACGCWVLGSDGGGLPEAIGPAGMTFRRGDLTDLCDKLMKVLNAPPENPSSAIAAHLERHQPWRIASEYLQLLKQVLRSQKAELREAQLRSDAEQVPVRRC